MRKTIAEAKAEGSKKAVNVASKMRNRDNPYATWTDTRTGWKFTLLKSWQVNNGTSTARWFMRVQGWEDEMGDTYVREMFPGLQWATDLTFDTAIWENKTRFIEWAQGTN